MGYLPGKCGYCVRSIATHHFFTSGNVIFDENIAYDSIHSVPASTHNYSALPFLEQLGNESDIPAAPMLPPNPSNLEDLDLAQSPHLDTDALPPPLTISIPVTLPHTSQLPLVLDTPNPVHTCSRDPLKTRKLTERGQIFETEIEAKKLHLVRV